MTISKSNSTKTPAVIGQSTTLMHFILLLALLYVEYILVIVISELIRGGIPNNFIEILGLFARMLFQYFWFSFIAILSMLMTPVLLIFVPASMYVVLFFLGKLAGNLIIVKHKNPQLVGILTLFISCLLIYICSSLLYALYHLIDNSFNSTIRIIKESSELLLLPILLSATLNAFIIGPFLGKTIQSLGKKLPIM